jgi:hypothetical protein
MAGLIYLRKFVMTTSKLLFLLGATCSKIYKYPSKEFVVFLAVLLSGLTVYLASSFTPILVLLPGFFKEWWQIGSIDNFSMYLIVASYSLLIYAVISMVKGAAFDTACFLKQKFGFRFVPW